MEFNVQKDKIFPYLQLISGIIENKQTLPILSNVLLKLEKNNLLITGSDLEIEINISLELEEVIEEGEATVPFQKVFDFCRFLQEEAIIKIKLEENNQIFIKSDKSKFHLSGLDAKSFPKTEVKPIVKSLKLKQKELLKSLNEVGFSMALQNIRYSLKGVLFEIEDNNLNFVSTDTHRLSLSQINLNESSNENTQAIIPRKTVLEMIKVLSDKEDEIKIDFCENQMLLSFDNVKIISRLIEGQYPKYQNVIPKSNDKEILINKELFKKSLQRVAILSNEKYKGAKFNFKENLLKITSRNSFSEHADEEISLNYDYSELNIGMNSQYILEVLNNIKSEEVLIFAKSEMESFLFKNKDSEYPIYIISPMQL